jgi:hypothetical protein
MMVWPLVPAYMNWAPGVRSRRAWAAALLCSLVACGGGGGSWSDPETATALDTEGEEEESRAPVDYGIGPVAAAGALTETLKALSAAGAVSSAPTPPAGSPQAYQAGVFGAVFAWPLIPLHAVLLPDGRVLGYGTDDKGAQGAKFHYALWDPNWNPDAPGADASPFQLLSNTTGTDLFCSTQLVLPNSGQVLLAGGSRLVDGKRNYANADVNLFNPADDSLRPEGTNMAFRRWYASSITTAQGEVVLLGGRDDMGSGTSETSTTGATYSTTPEIYSPGRGWRSLTNARSGAVYGTPYSNWFYPKSFLVSDGRVLTITHDGYFYALDTANLGVLSKLPGRIPATAPGTVSLMYAPGKILSVRASGAVSLIEYAAGKITASTGAPLSSPRRTGSGTLLPDGQVWLNGGSNAGNVLEDAVYTSEMWNPATGQWTLTATAAKPRLYHSTALLLPSGAVMTAGGGAPGPVRNLNGELYYPPYFFNPDGSYAVRPVIEQVAPASFSWSESFTVQMSNSNTVAKVVLIRTGSATHAFNNEQRRMELEFSQSGSVLTVKAPAQPAEMPPGYYMLFVLKNNPKATAAGDTRLVPSEARIVKLS